MQHIEGLDDKDNMILSLLEENARMSYSDIGEKVGLTRVAVKARIDSLEERGIIRGYRVVVNSEAVEENKVKFMMFLEVYQDKMEDVLEILAREKIVKEISILTGTDRVFISGYTAVQKNIYVLTNRLYRETDKIRSITPSVVMLTVKDTSAGIEYKRPALNPEIIEGNTK